MCAALRPLQACPLSGGKFRFPSRAIPCPKSLPLQARLGLLFLFLPFFCPFVLPPAWRGWLSLIQVRRCSGLVAFPSPPSIIPLFLHVSSLSTGRNFEAASPLFWGKQKAGVSSSLRIKIQFFPTVLQTLLRKACIRSTPAITAASKAAASSPSPSAIRSPAGMSPHAGWPKPTPSKAQRIWEI